MQKLQEYHLAILSSGSILYVYTHECACQYRIVKHARKLFRVAYRLLSCSMQAHTHVERSCLYAARAPLIDWLGHAMQSTTVPVSQSTVTKVPRYFSCPCRTEAVCTGSKPLRSLYSEYSCRQTDTSLHICVLRVNNCCKQ